MVIKRIVELDSETYNDFCHWLMDQNTWIGALVKKRRATQERKLEDFLSTRVNKE